MRLPSTMRAFGPREGTGPSPTGTASAQPSENALFRDAIVEGFVCCWCNGRESPLAPFPRVQGQGDGGFVSLTGLFQRFRDNDRLADRVRVCFHQLPDQLRVAL